MRNGSGVARLTHTHTYTHTHIHIHTYARTAAGVEIAQGNFTCGVEDATIPGSEYADFCSLSRVAVYDPTGACELYQGLQGEWHARVSILCFFFTKKIDVQIVS